MLIDVMRTTPSTSHTKEHDKDYVTDIHITSICLCYSIFVRSHNMFTSMRFKAPSGKELHKKRTKKKKRESYSDATTTTTDEHQFIQINFRFTNGIKFFD